jgi:hypothetical protein
MASILSKQSMKIAMHLVASDVHGLVVIGKLTPKIGHLELGQLRAS